MKLHSLRSPTPGACAAVVVASAQSAVGAGEVYQRTVFRHRLHLQLHVGIEGGNLVAQPAELLLQRLPYALHVVLRQAHSARHTYLSRQPFLQRRAQRALARHHAHSFLQFVLTLRHHRRRLLNKVEVNGNAAVVYELVGGVGVKSPIHSEWHLFTHSLSHLHLCNNVALAVFFERSPALGVVLGNRAQQLAILPLRHAEKAYQPATFLHLSLVAAYAQCLTHEGERTGIAAGGGEHTGAAPAFWVEKLAVGGGCRICAGVRDKSHAAQHRAQAHTLKLGVEGSFFHHGVEQGVYHVMGQMLTLRQVHYLHFLVVCRVGKQQHLEVARSCVVIHSTTYKVNRRVCLYVYVQCLHLCFLSFFLI